MDFVSGLIDMVNLATISRLSDVFLVSRVGVVSMIPNLNRIIRVSSSTTLRGPLLTDRPTTATGSDDMTVSTLWTLVRPFILTARVAWAICSDELVGV